MKKRRLWWAGAAALGAVTVVLVVRRSAPVPPAPSPPDTQALERQVSALRGELRAVAARQALAAPTPAEKPAPDPAPSRETRAAELRLRVQVARETMEHQLQREGHDPGATARVGKQIETLYASTPFAGTRLESVECGATLCRVASRHDSEEARRRFGREASRHPPFDNEVFYTRSEHDPTSSTLYVALPGRALPRPNGAPPAHAMVTPASM